MKKRIAILSLLFFVFVIYLAPASLLEKALPENSPVAIIGITGSLWSGNVELISHPKIQLSDIDYGIKPLALLGGKLGVDLDIYKGAIQGGLGLKAGSDYQQSLSVSDANIAFSSSIIQSMIPFNGVELNGKITTHDLAIEIENQRPKEVEGSISWSDASVVFADKEWPLGDFSVLLETDSDSGQVRGQMLQARNTLDLKGSFVLSANGVLEFKGSVSTEIEPPVYTAVSIFNDGKAENGRLPIKFTQKIYR